MCDASGRALGFRRTPRDEAQLAERGPERPREEEPADLDLNLASPYLLDLATDEAGDRSTRALRPSWVWSLLVLRATEVSEPKRGLTLRDADCAADGNDGNQFNMLLPDKLSSEFMAKATGPKPAAGPFGVTLAFP